MAQVILFISPVSSLESKTYERTWSSLKVQLGGYWRSAKRGWWWQRCCWVMALTGTGTLGPHSVWPAASEFGSGPRNDRAAGAEKITASFIENDESRWSCIRNRHQQAIAKHCNSWEPQRWGEGILWPLHFLRLAPFLHDNHWLYIYIFVYIYIYIWWFPEIEVPL